ncbi:ABC transporter permease [Rhizobium oryzicola]|uniref:ABC transporter permease n=1 Tax=Rhizobium oryzicola TaxID=1232668 RepID=A0ABT8T2T7_9HYPH|nr:ABC transporter permease [Rhizobium oryzicola]MDO1585032.1 ABC transporter permease [Rhizobium oryzicola]
MTETTLNDMQDVETGTGREERVYQATPAQLMWWRFKRHKVAMLSGIILIAAYLIVALAEFVAPYDAFEANSRSTLQPPQAIHFFDEQGSFRGPFVYGFKRGRDPVTMRPIYVADTTKVIPINFFVRGQAYKFWGLFEGNLHLYGTTGPDRINLLGTDTLGRDMVSRLIHGGRISLSVGLIGVAVSFVLGITLGSISGYFGGITDNIVQRGMEFLRSIPTIPLWMGLAAALPITWDPLFVYFLVTLLLSLIGWTYVARTVRGRFLSIKNEDFVLAARFCGTSEAKIITRHMLPSMTSYIIAALTLAVPDMILGETALSFLGLGLRPPVVSWGVLLQDAQNLRTIAQAPWLLAPGAAIVIIVLAFNFLGDGLRDAADPYSK